MGSAERQKKGERMKEMRKNAHFFLVIYSVSHLSFPFLLLVCLSKCLDVCPYLNNIMLSICLAMSSLSTISFVGSRFHLGKGEAGAPLESEKRLCGKRND